MPYKVEKRGDKWLTVNTETGKLKGTHTTRGKAVAQMRLLYGVKHDMKPRKKKKYKVLHRD